MSEFEAFGKIPRLSREIVITEKIDGTNGQIYIYRDSHMIEDNFTWISDDLCMKIGSRSRWLSYHEDNHGFWHWAQDNKEELFKLGEGRHFGEWWGSGIQRGYGLTKGEKRFSLFNTHRWADYGVRPKCCSVVPILYRGKFDTDLIDATLGQLDINGSVASPGFMDPEGIIIYHTAGNLIFKKTIEKDEEPKGKKV